MKIYGGLGLGLAAFLYSSTALAQKYDGSGSPHFVPHTLREALATAYLTNPTLLQERAMLRATDENVSQALAGWRPKITGNIGGMYSTGGYYYTQQSGWTPSGQPLTSKMANTIHHYGYSAGMSVQQPIYQGGKTTAQTHQSVNQVMAERAKLISTEQQVFQSVVQAYVDLVQAQQMLQLNINNEQVLIAQVQATYERFRVGEITRTDLAQAEASLATARAQKQQSQGSLQVAQANYLQAVGVQAPPNLLPPQPLRLPVKSEQEAVAMAAANNPDVINALFTEAAQKDAVSVQMSQLMPQVSAQLQWNRYMNQQQKGTQDYKTATLQMQVPIYQGGGEYSAIRQAKQQAQAAHGAVNVARRKAIQQAATAWQQLVSYKAAISSSRRAVGSNVVALDGVERQAVVGTSTTFEMLQQQETLLQSQIALVQNLSNMVMASYNVAFAIGKLTARDLKLDVPLYDDKAYYNAVKDRLWGINDYATNQPGR